MKIRSRLILLLGCLLAGFAAATWTLHAGHKRETRTIRSSVKKQRSALLDHLLTLTGQSLRTFASDYSLWDDMVSFIRSGDRGWARINLDSNLVNFDTQGAWVLRRDGSLVYQAGELSAGTIAVLPFGQPAFQAHLEQQRQLHFYLEAPDGLLEVRVMPIQPSADIARTSPALGWFAVARLWNQAHLQTLAEALQGRVHFDAPAPEPGNPAIIHLERNLPDWAGRPVRILHVDHESLALSSLAEGNQDETLVLLVFGLLMIGTTAVSLSSWVLSPLQQLGRSLETGRPDALEPLRGDKNEFGHLARLVEQSFSQRAALEREVQVRSRLAAELQETGNQLRESIELRSRLARDLHDGVIQSIYAAGLGLEGVRSVLPTDPAAAEHRLASCQTALNDTIHDVRAFINGLESQPVPVRPFRQTLATLVATLQSIQPGHIALEVDEAVAARISPAQELQVLQILRESISNALRHAAAAAIRLSLRGGTGQSAVLTVADDGCGFDPGKSAGRGHGLVNLGIRAREMGGSLLVEAAPGKGTRVTLLFHPAYPS